MKRTKPTTITMTIPDFSPISAYLRACGWITQADAFDAKYAPVLLRQGVTMPIRFGCALGYTDSSMCSLTMIYGGGVTLDITFPHTGFVAGCCVSRRTRGKYGPDGQTERCSQLDPDLAARLLAIFIADASVKDSDRKIRPE